MEPTALGACALLPVRHTVLGAQTVAGVRGRCARCSSSLSSEDRTEFLVLGLSQPTADHLNLSLNIVLIGVREQ